MTQASLIAKLAHDLKTHRQQLHEAQDELARCRLTLKGMIDFQTANLAAWAQDMAALEESRRRIKDLEYEVWRREAPQQEAG